MCKINRSVFIEVLNNYSLESIVNITKKYITSENKEYIFEFIKNCPEDDFFKILKTAVEEEQELICPEVHNDDCPEGIICLDCWKSVIKEDVIGN